MLLAIGNNRGGRPAATATAVVVVVIAAVAMVAAASAATDDEDTDQSDFDDMWETNMKQEEFDGMPLPDDSELTTTTTASPTTTQPPPVVVKIGQRYGVLTKGSTKEKDTPSLKDYFPDNLVGMSVGTVISLGSLAMVAMASKALLLALGAILLTCLSSGWTIGGGGGGGATTHKSDKTVPVGIVGGGGDTVFEVIAKPHVSYGHTYSSEIHYEPYVPPQQPVQPQSSPPPKQPASNVHTYDFTYGHRRRRDVR